MERSSLTAMLDVGRAGGVVQQAHRVRGGGGSGGSGGRGDRGGFGRLVCRLALLPG